MPGQAQIERLSDDLLAKDEIYASLAMLARSGQDASLPNERGVRLRSRHCQWTKARGTGQDDPNEAALSFKPREGSTGPR